MTHSATCTGTEPESVSLDVNCEDCRTKRVGDLDDPHFTQLMGCSRRVFEQWCQNLPSESHGGGPSGLYAFWYAIMNAEALPIQFRAEELRRRAVGVR